jgi:hypothetical protein
VCDREDLEYRAAYVKGAANDRDLDLYPVAKLDQTSVSWRLRLKVRIPQKHKYVSNEHWRFAVRRAAYRACEQTGFPDIAKRTVRLASDALNYRNRSAGVDYVEFGVTRPAAWGETGRFVIKLGTELYPWMEAGTFFEVVPAEAELPSRPVSLWELEVGDDPAAVAAALRRWEQAAEVPVLIKSESFYAGAQQEKENAKDHVADLWLTRDQHRYVLKLILTGRLGPYQAYAALLGKPSWLEAARYTAQRLDFFTSANLSHGDLFQPACVGCGYAIPAGLLGAVFDDTYCPRCKDEAESVAVAGLTRAGV